MTRLVLKFQHMVNEKHECYMKRGR